MNDPLPSGWQRNRVFRVVTRTIQGRSVPQVEGVDVIRHCGCTLTLGHRLDRSEATGGATHCDLHEAQVRRALDFLQSSPPSEQEIGQMFAEALERELAISP